MPRGRSGSHFDLAQARRERNRCQGNHRQHSEGVYLRCRATARNPDEVLDNLLTFTKALMDQVIGHSCQAIVADAASCKTSIAIDGAPAEGVRTFVD
jgi:hypothetical protein